MHSDTIQGSLPSSLPAPELHVEVRDMHPLPPRVPPNTERKGTPPPLSSGSAPKQGRRSTMSSSHGGLQPTGLSRPATPSSSSQHATVPTLTGSSPDPTKRKRTVSQETIDDSAKRTSTRISSMDQTPSSPVTAAITAADPIVEHTGTSPATTGTPSVITDASRLPSGKGKEPESKKVLSKVAHLRMKRNQTTAPLSDLERADRKYTDAAMLINTLYAGHALLTSSLQKMIEDAQALSECEDGMLQATAADIQRMQETISTDHRKVVEQIQSAEQAFVSRYPKSNRLFLADIGEKTVQPSQELKAWSERGFDQGRGMLEEGDRFEEEE